MKLAGLNPEQQQAVKHGAGPLLVVAGAGTGKTQVITTRIAHLIDQGVKPSQILAVTFTDKAAREMETRVAELLGKYVLDVKVTTFNAYGQEILQRFAFELGLNANLTLLTQTQQLIWLRDHLDQLNLRYFAPITKPEGFLAELAKYFSKLKSELITPEMYTKFVHGLKTKASDPAGREERVRHMELAGAYAQYVKLTRAEGVIDFDDQVSLAVELLAKRLSVRAKLQAETQYLLVDEFQDTNTAQSQLIDLLAAKTANVMVVGDDDQSIYRFRGAAVANILGFKQRYPKAKQLSLVKNYRTSQDILDAAYHLIQYNNPDRLEAKYKLSKQLTAQFRAEPPKLQTFLTYEEEAQWVAEDIKGRLKAGEAPTDIAVLYRKNDQAKILAKYLASAGVDHLVVGESQDLYRQPEVKLLLNFIKTVVDPKDSESLYHLLTSPIYALSPGWLREQVSSARRQHHPLEVTLRVAAADPVEAVKLANFWTSLDKWREHLPNLSVGQLAYQFLTDTGYLKKLVSGAKADPALDQQVFNLNQFFTTLHEYERVAEDVTAVGFANALPLLAGAGERLAQDDLADLYGQKVKLLTIHKAKGLEFESVYLFDLTQDTFPSRRQASGLEIPEQLLAKELILSGDPHLQEERRLMYVAMTRAKRNLIITYSADHGGRAAKRPSIFIEEALGEQPAFAGTKLKRAHTDQIELFRSFDKKPSKRTTELPAGMWRGETLLLSQRQVEDYLMCPAEFYLRYVIAPPQPVSFALEYGNLIHNLIQLYNRRRLDDKAPKLEELMTYLQANWPQESFVTPGHRDRSLAQAKSTLKKFYEREAKAPRHPNLIEHAFEFELPEAGVAIRGRLDAVYEEAGDSEIRDYKTGAVGIDSAEKAEKKAKDSFQLAVYALAWQQLRGEIPAMVSLDFVDSGFIGRATKTPKQLATVEAKIREAAAGIRAGNFKPATSHLFCTHAEYGF